MQRSIQLNYINPFLTCTVCTGYLVDATTIVECLHSFCRSCIIRHLEVSYNCPKCNTEIHKTKPFEYIRSDPCLQEVVYKLVPELYSREEVRKNKWKKTNIPAVDNNDGELIDDEEEDNRILVTLKYFRGTSRMERIKTERVLQMFPTRYLCCQPDMPIRVLKKFVRYKFDISSDLFTLEMWRGDETLKDELTLKQLVQIYGLYRERKPLDLHYSIVPKFEMKEEVEEEDVIEDKEKPLQIPSPLPRLHLQPENEAAEGTADNEQEKLPTEEKIQNDDEPMNDASINENSNSTNNKGSDLNDTNDTNAIDIPPSETIQLDSLSPVPNEQQQQTVTMDTDINNGTSDDGGAELNPLHKPMDES